MMLSDDKISHTTHMLLRGMIEHKLVDLKAEESEVRREIKRTIVNEMKIGEDMHEIVVKKLLSFSRKLTEGSPEWEVLYKKFYEEEGVRRGRK